MSAVEEKIQEYMPVIRAELVKQVGNLDQVDEVTLMKGLVFVHGKLPRAVRFVVKQDKFVHYCIEKKDLLVENYSE